MFSNRKAVCSENCLLTFLLTWQHQIHNKRTWFHNSTGKEDIQTNLNSICENYHDQIKSHWEQQKTKQEVRTNSNFTSVTKPHINYQQTQMHLMAKFFLGNTEALIPGALQILLLCNTMFGSCWKRVSSGEGAGEKWVKLVLNTLNKCLLTYEFV